MGVEGRLFEGQRGQDVRLLLADRREPGDGLCVVERDAVMLDAAKLRERAFR